MGGLLECCHARRSTPSGRGLLSRTTAQCAASSRGLIISPPQFSLSRAANARGSRRDACSEAARTTWPAGVGSCWTDVDRAAMTSLRQEDGSPGCPNPAERVGPVLRLDDRHAHMGARFPRPRPGRAFSNAFRCSHLSFPEHGLACKERERWTRAARSQLSLAELPSVWFAATQAVRWGDRNVGQ